MYDYIPEAVKPGMTPPMDSEKTLYILNQQNNCCCKIKSKLIGTGFLCKITLLDSLKVLPVLITCNHVLNEESIKVGKVIDFTMNNDKIKFSILIDD